MLGVNMLRMAAIYMVLGLGMGMAMAVSGDHTLSSVHSHLSLLGWATMAITGLVYLVLPDCAGNRLATLHFWGHVVGLPVMMASLALKIYGHAWAEPVLGGSSVLVLLSLVVFSANLLRNGRAVTSAR